MVNLNTPKISIRVQKFKHQFSILGRSFIFNICLKMKYEYEFLGMGLKSGSLKSVINEVCYSSPDKDDRGS